MNKRYFLEIAYNGENYYGWQMQPNAVSVQSTIDNALSVICNQQIRSLGCGRTDSGVHASQFFLHFDGPEGLPENFLYRINKFLPKDIAIVRLIDDVPADAHARYHATYRAYTYHIHFNKDPYLFQSSFFYPWEGLDITLMRKAADLLLNYSEFPMFCKTKGNNKTFTCLLYKTEIVVDKKLGRLKFHIAANRFLRGMVRRIVGCLLMIGQKKISIEEFVQVMESQGANFPSANMSAPPQGLYLVEVRYPYIDNRATPDYFDKI